MRSDKMIRREIFNDVLPKYLSCLNQTNWIYNEAYKFEYANYIQYNIDFQHQSDEEILGLLKLSQDIKYGKAKGVQFIKNSGRNTLKSFVELSDVKIFRQFKSSGFDGADFANRNMSYTILSVWLTSLFPERIFPVPATDIFETINYLFRIEDEHFPKRGLDFILACQDYMDLTQVELKKYPIEDIHLKVWNRFYGANPQLNIKPKANFDQLDWNWISQDFHLFVFREILKRYKTKGQKRITVSIADDIEEATYEGNSVLATHMRYERSDKLIRKIKEKAVQANPMLNCEVCGFSFFEKYGELGKGFVEAHHKRPLSETKSTNTKREDIALLCSNCHKMIHRGKSIIDGNTIMSIDELRDLIID